MRIKALLFDMDGTMVDNMRFHNLAWRTWLAEQGVEISDEDFYARGAGHTNTEILRTFYAADLTPAEIDRMKDEKEELYREMIKPHLKPVPGLPELLASARRLGLKTAVATSAPHVNLNFHLDGMHLRPFFDALVGEEDVRHGKPAPDLFLEAARRLGVDAGACLVFEDSPPGLEAVRRANMRAIALTVSYPASVLESQPAVLQLIPDYRALPADLAVYLETL